MRLAVSRRRAYTNISDAIAPCGKIGELSPRPSQVDLLEVVALVVLGLKGWGAGVTWLLGLAGRWGF